MEEEEEDIDQQGEGAAEGKGENIEELFDEDEDLEDLDNFIIRPTDGILVAAANDGDDYSHLDVYVFEEDVDNLYIHHDMLLPAFPLSVAYLDHPLDARERNNILAVGTFSPGIELWDLDVVDTVEPTAVLGGTTDSIYDQKSSKNRSQNLSPGSHADAVLSLSWNTFFRNIMTSGSADETIKFWDLAKLSCLHTFKNNGKVQSVSWNPVESNILLGGSFGPSGGQASLFDIKNPNSIASVTLSGDVECVQWNPTIPQQFLVSTDTGEVTCYDARKLDKCLYSFFAHKKATTSISLNPAMDGLLATVSADKTLKLWDLRSQSTPSCIYTEDLHMGKLFSVSFYVDSPFQLGIGGEKQKPIVYNTASIPAVQQTFSSL
eukprot:TRINITY_DN2601_c0_g1_i2.p1 TRINITY_DN2601_c0_g1~~TRINITY_DN2601_c0_g1_i2.p1  ORF type:complete len:407 (+),score=103.79 TRINITY_DN2601_c0_g1_i2:91-1221(+)